MRITIILMLTLFTAACEFADKGQTDISKVKPEDIVKTLSDVTTDTKQKALWKGVNTALASDIKKLSASGGVVRERKPIKVPDVEVKRPDYPPLSEKLITGVNLLEVPDLAEPFSGKARLIAVKQDTLQFDLGKDRLLMVQAKVGGQSFLLEKGADVKLRVQFGDPFNRNDVLEISNSDSALSWALVGGGEPVKIAFRNINIVARQIGKPHNGTMIVEVKAGNETRILTKFAEPVQFTKANITVHVLGSIGAIGNTAGVLPQDYRLEITAWPSQ